MAITREDLKELPKLLQQDPELRLELAEQILDEVTIARLMHKNTALRDAFRRVVLTEELLQLPAEFHEFREETTARLTRVEQDVAETKERMTRVEQDVAETKERMTRVEQTVEKILHRVDRLEGAVERLENWQRGEQGRREGEDYERLMVARARRIFGTGDGGSPMANERVRKQVEAWLEAAGLLDQDIEPDYDPLIADLIWWKGNRVAVAEISVKVNGRDVVRAKRRAETLREAGLDVLPVVIGSEWAHPETEQLAKQEGVAWRVANTMSEALIEFRRAG
ncbi:MAG: hypothetical protein CFK49_08905 [Armatimonadetes bacterium JP3_11]|nr:MAG: hypothetical protein CFK48_07745 [Armatimonadetes bacterium CP1_7O]OYT74337.1 MAG: hypothetical protein CFK49_08905 [Armatimonadetes bacterium JP3_11]RMH09845.1 MAG: hypothetical protein D6697_02570 [Armatimonadota bacterium]